MKSELEATQDLWWCHYIFVNKVTPWNATPDHRQLQHSQRSSSLDPKHQNKRCALVRPAVDMLGRQGKWLEISKVERDLWIISIFSRLWKQKASGNLVDGIACSAGTMCGFCHYITGCMKCYLGEGTQKARCTKVVQFDQPRTVLIMMILSFRPATTTMDDQHDCLRLLVEAVTGATLENLEAQGLELAEYERIEIKKTSLIIW